VKHSVAFCIALFLLFCAGPLRADETPSVTVQTEPARRDTVPIIVTAYGLVVPALDGTMNLSFQQEGRVLAIRVLPGETVKAGTQLLDFGFASNAISSFQQAVKAVDTAREQRAHTAQLLAQQLATRDQLAQAEKAVADAEATLQAIKREGGDQSHQFLTAPFDGVVSTINVTQGDRVAAGALLMTITRPDGLVVRVGLEPSTQARVRPGDTVQMTSLTDGTVLQGVVRRIDNAINPKTRLVDADITVTNGVLLAGTAFKAEITVGHIAGWVVPHDAILFDDSGAYLFQAVSQNVARVSVKLLGTAGMHDVVEGALDAQHPVIVEGNYQLSDKTMIRQGEAQ